MATFKFTANITCVFEFKGNYTEAQAWLIKHLEMEKVRTHMNIQKIDLVRWSDPVTNKPVDQETGKPVDV